MALSAITPVTSARFATDLSAFTLAGVPYLVWRTDVPGTSRAWWRRHDGANGTEVALQHAVPLQAIAAAGCSDGTRVLLVYATSPGVVGDLWAIAASVATGLTVGEPAFVGRGGRPALAAIGAGRHAVTYRDASTGAVHLRETYDDGLTWSTARPVLNNKVRDDVDLSLVVFDGTHLSLGQVGTGGRTLVETGSAARSRPVTAVVVSGERRLLVAEAAVRTGQVTDNLRGRMALTGAGDVLLASRARQGTSDGVGDLALYDAFPDAPGLLSSAVVAAGAAPGGEIVRAPAGAPAAGVVIATLAGAEVVADLAVFDGHALYTGFATTAATGRAGWVNLDTLAGGEFDLGVGVTWAGAVAAAAAAAGGFDLLVVGFTAGGAEWLRLGAWVAPPGGVALADAHRMPARVNALALVLTGATNGRLYVGMADRLNVYAFDGLGRPIRLLRTHPLLTGGEVHQIVALDNENVVAALGASGLGVFGLGGEVLGQVLPSSIPAMLWKPLTAYGLNALVRPTDQHPYSPQRRHFICTRAGTSGRVEPAWGPTGTTNDPNGSGAGWTEVGTRDAVITGVAVDQALGRIFAVGLLGGPTAAAGRIYSLDAVGLISAPTRAPAPSFNVDDGATYTGIMPAHIETPLPAADIYYTLDGSSPGPSSTLYVHGSTILFDLSGSYVIRAVALAVGFLPSKVATVRFNVDLPDIPPVLASPPQGSYTAGGFNVVLTCAQIGVAIHYTTDGSPPTALSPVYAAGIPVPIPPGTYVIKAVAMQYGCDDSPVATFTYDIFRSLIPDDPAAISHFRVDGGAFGDLNVGRDWVENGTVPKVPAAIIITGRPAVWGVGPFSDANFYELAGSAVGTDVFDTLMGGDFTITFILKGGVHGQVWFCDGIYPTPGFFFQHWQTAECIVAFGSVGIAPAQNILDSNVHVISFGRTGGTWRWKVDKNAVTSGSFGAEPPTPAPNYKALIGRYQNAGNGFTGILYEARFLTGGPASAADLDALHAAIIP